MLVSHVQMAEARATASNPFADGLATPSPFTGSRTQLAPQTAPEGRAAEEGSSEKKPFLKRRSRHVPVSQRYFETPPKKQTKVGIQNHSL